MSKNIILILLGFIFIFALIGCDTQIATNLETKTYYVDSVNGNDNNTGLSENDAIQTISKTNQLPLKPGDTVLFKCGDTFRGNLIPTSGSMEQRITYSSYGEGAPPILMGSFSLDQISSSIQLVQDDIYTFMFAYDIGNIIINNGELFGVKRFSLSALNNPLDYYYDRSRKIFYLKADEILANQINTSTEGYSSVEFCVTQSIVNMSNKHDLTFTNLALKYGSAHGFSGSETHRVTIENCVISYIGGGFLFYREDGEPERYGNGIEIFDTGSDIDIIGCKIFEIFDTAVTNQGAKRNSYHTNITYKDNIIYNCGMAAFELWNQGAGSTMTNISFENNNVHDIGYGFSLTQQRQNTLGLGHFITDFGNIATMDNISIKNNTFNNAYNEHEISSLLLISDLVGDISNYPLYLSIIDNQYTGVDYKVVYRNNDEVYYIN